MEKWNLNVVCCACVYECSVCCVALWVYSPPPPLNPRLCWAASCGTARLVDSLTLWLLPVFSQWIPCQEYMGESGEWGLDTLPNSLPADGCDWLCPFVKSPNSIRWPSPRGPALKQALWHCSLSFSITSSNY